MRNVEVIERIGRNNTDMLYIYIYKNIIKNYFLFIIYISIKWDFYSKNLLLIIFDNLICFFLDVTPSLTNSCIRIFHLLEILFCVFNTSTDIVFTASTD